MILLFGGTAETASLARGLARAGHPVLVSTATDLPLDCGDEEKIQRRSGPLDGPAMLDLIRRQGITAVVDAGHPFAAELHANAHWAAGQAGIPLLRYERPPINAYENADIIRARNHGQAAHLACAAGSPILLTIGSKNLGPYVAAAKQKGAVLFARVLPQASSREACRKAGLDQDRLIFGRGPFSLEENRRLLKEKQIKVLVSKESGAAGGLWEKFAAAREQGCRVVLVERPPANKTCVFYRLDNIIRALSPGSGRYGS